MDSSEVYAKVASSLAEVLGIDESEVQPTATLVGVLQASSLDVVDLLFQLKKVFSVELTLAEVQRELLGADEGAGSGGFDDTLFQDVTVNDVVGWIEKRLPAKQML